MTPNIDARRSSLSWKRLEGSELLQDLEGSGAYFFGHCPARSVVVSFHRGDCGCNSSSLNGLVALLCFLIFTSRHTLGLHKTYFWLPVYLREYVVNLSETASGTAD